MGRKKNPENKTREEAIKEKLGTVKTYLPSDSFEDQKIKEIFGSFWASARKSYNRPKDLEDVLWAHLKSIGHNKPELFEKGIEHFGLRK